MNLKIHEALNSFAMSTIYVCFFSLIASSCLGSTLTMPLRYPRSKSAIDERHVHVIPTRTVLTLMVLGAAGVSV